MRELSMKMRHICIIIILAWLLSIAVAISTRDIAHYEISVGLGFIGGAIFTRRIAFDEVPANHHLLIILGLPLALALYVITGDLLSLGKTVAWALIALSLSAGARAANLRQLLAQEA